MYCVYSESRSSLLIESTDSIIVQGRLKGDKKTYAFVLDIQKAYATLWRDGLCYKL